MKQQTLYGHGGFKGYGKGKAGLPLVSPSILVEAAGITYFLLPHCGSNWHAVCFT